MHTLPPPPDKTTDRPLPPPGMAPYFRVYPPPGDRAAIDAVIAAALGLPPAA